MRRGRTAGSSRQGDRIAPPLVVEIDQLMPLQAGLKRSSGVRMDLADQAALRVEEDRLERRHRPVLAIAKVSTLFRGEIGSGQDLDVQHEEQRWPPITR